MRVLVVGCNTWWNKGDAALLMVMDAELRTRLPDIDLTYPSHSPQLDHDRMGMRFVRDLVARRWNVPEWLRDGARSVSPMWPAVGLTAQTLSRDQRMAAWSALQDWGIPSTRVLMPRGLAHATKVISDHDVVLGAPGGYLQTATRYAVAWQAAVAPMLIAHRIGRPVLLAPVTVGPFATFQRPVADRVVSRSRLVLLRESDSLPWALRSGIPRDHVEVVADLAWLTPSAEPRPVLREALVRSDGPLVGFAVRAFRPLRLGERSDSYLEALVDTADRLIEEVGARVVFLPQAGHKGDVLLRQGIARRMRRADRVTWVEDDLSPGELRAAYGELDLLIASRLHAAILAMTAGTPAITMAYGLKTTGIMRALGRTQDMVPIYSVTSDWLMERAEATLRAGRAGRELLATQVAPVQAQAVRALDLLAEGIERAVRHRSRDRR